VMDSALSPQSNWLSGLAALLVAEYGTYLAAGPIGVMLAKMKVEPDNEQGERGERQEAAQMIGNIGRALEQFGFTPEEVHYLESRLTAGSILIARTDDDEEQIARTLRTFGDFNAVFIGQAQTSNEVVIDAERWIANPRSPAATEIIVADVVVALRHACLDSSLNPTIASHCHQTAEDVHGQAVGEIEEILIDAVDDAIVRYLVIGHGGILGIARHRTVVPGELVEFTPGIARLKIANDQLDSAPSYDPGTPFSRKDELAAHQFFGTTPYWLEISPTSSTLAATQ
jgi:hypothetical protein